MSEETPEERLARARRGDRAALSALLDSLTPALLRMLELRMDAAQRRRFGPDDVLQEAFVEATRRFDEWCAQDRYPFGVWMRLLTSQALQRALRRHRGVQKRDEQRDCALDAARASVSAQSATDWLIATGTSPSQAASRAEVRARVLAALTELDELDREILALRHFEQRTNEEAALELGLEPAAASKRFTRALQRLRPALRGLEPDGPRPAP